MTASTPSKPSAAAFAAAGAAYLGTPYSTMDCQAFVERCMRDAGIRKDLPGSNAWYRAMTWTGTPEECKSRFGSIPSGAILFILEQNDKEPEKYRKDGIGNASHMGIKTGTGLGAIHSSSSRGGVCESFFSDKTIRNGGWNRVGLWDSFDYGEKINKILKGVEPNVEAEPNIKPESTIQPVTKVVWAREGNNVFLRSRKSTGAPYLVRIPVGTEVQVTNDDGTWSDVQWDGWFGYMKDEFLRDPQNTPAVSASATGAPDPDPTMGEGSVTLIISAAVAQVLLPALESVVDQLVNQIGRG